MRQSDSVLPVLVAQLRHRAARTLALFLALLVATTAFTVLTGATQTSTLVVTGAVEKNFRPAYDILVRPTDTRTTVEQRSGLVRESYLSTQETGGITWDQLDAVRSTPGVATAAPAAILGYVMETAHITVDLSRFVRSSGRQVLKVDVSRRVDSGLSRVLGERTVFVYLTDEPLDGSYLTAGEFTDPIGPQERVRGDEVVVCPWSDEDAVNAGALKDPFDPFFRTDAFCWSRASSEGFRRFGQIDQITGPPGTIVIPVSFPMLVAAIDPESEARLVGLDAAVTDGRYLRPAEGTREFPMPGFPPGESRRARELPVLRATRPFAAGQDLLTVSDLGTAGVEVMTGGALASAQLKTLRGLPERPLGSVTLDAGDAYAALPGVMDDAEAIAGDRSEDAERRFVGELFTVGPPAVQAQDGLQVSVQSKEVSADPWNYGSFSQEFLPAVETLDTPFREVRAFFGDNMSERGDAYFKVPTIRIVGTFDPEQVQTGSELASVPLSLYTPSRLIGGDGASVAALKGGPLLPNGSMVGYAQEPPMLLTSIQAMRDARLGTAYKGLSGLEAAPFGSVRVKVEGAVGVDGVSRERVRLIADRIVAATGLDVDIVTGSSPTGVQVDLPGGRFGRPDLVLTESWVKKGVAVQLLQAVDRKSAALFGLILVVTGFFVANAVSAVARERHRELAVLSAVGWTRGALARHLLGEVGLVGLAAGAVAALLAWPMARVVGIDLDWWRPLVAVPAAVLLALLAGLAPVLRASRVRPATALARSARSGGRAVVSTGVVGMALSNVLRHPGRAAVGGAGLAVGVAALTVILGVTSAFTGAAVGTVLGDAVTLAVRPVDVIAVVTIVVLGAFATADVMFLALRERASELATLRALGWPERAVRRLVLVEGLAIAGVGAALGALLGLGSLQLFAGGGAPALLAPTAIAAAAGVAVALLALLVPAAALRRLNTARLLAEEE